MPTYSPNSRCTVQLRKGAFCDADRAPDMPFGICARHAITLYRRMHEMVTEVRGKHHEYPDLHAAVVQDVADAAYAKANTRQHQVYYVRIGELIKIGTSRNLEARVSSYPPGSELLAVERGGGDIERQRHHQFRHLLAERKEWFHPGPDLLDHIAALNKRPAVKAA